MDTAKDAARRREEDLAEDIRGAGPTPTTSVRPEPTPPPPPTPKPAPWPRSRLRLRSRLRRPSRRTSLHQASSATAEIVEVNAAGVLLSSAFAVVLLDGGHTDPGNRPDAQPEASFAELLAMLAAGPHPPTWDALAEILAESGDGQEWTLAA